MPRSLDGKTIRVGTRELRDNLAALLRRAQAGTNLLVTSRGRIIACLGPAPALGPIVRRPGRLHGRIRMSDDFDDLPVELFAPSPRDAT